MQATYLHFIYSYFQYIRKMSKLLEEGKLPTHVDPEAITCAPPSRRRPAEVDAPAVAAVADNPEDGDMQEQPASQPPTTNKTRAKKKARTRSPATSDTEASFSYEDEPSFEPDDFSHLVRSSSGEECD